MELILVGKLYAILSPLTGLDTNKMAWPDKK